ncbi:hypothetical protein V8E51_013534 [Hyaloscypha variabilis]
MTSSELYKRDRLHSQNGPIACQKFGSLPPEVQHGVMRHTNSHDLLNLARTSTNMYLRTIPMLYRTVDLRMHDMYYSPRIEPWFRILDSSTPEQEEVEDFLEKFREPMSNLTVQQNSFVAAMLKDPSLARHVVSLTWTYHRSLGQSREEEEKIWEVFALLDNVKDLDISFFLGHFTWRHHHAVVPPPVFRRASRIRIGGNASYAIFRAIMSNPSKLIDMELNNLQAFDQSRDGQPMNMVMGLPDAPETEEEAGWPLLRHAGPVHGYLRPLIGQLSNLQHLHLRIVGQQHPDEPN